MGKLFKFRLLFLTLLTGCSTILYYPDPYLYQYPNLDSCKFKEYFISSFDKTKLLVWDLRSNKLQADTLVVFFHGNAQNVSSHTFNLSWILAYNIDLLTFDYRGYGLSEGSPYPRGIYEDTIAFLDYALKVASERNIKKVILYAQSLGGEILLKPLSEYNKKNGDKFSVLVLDSTFSNPSDLVKIKLGKYFSWIVNSEYIAKAEDLKFNFPILVMHSPNDPIVPFELGVKLFHEIKSESKHFWEIKNGSHSDAFFVKNENYKEKFIDFLKKI